VNLTPIKDWNVKMKSKKKQKKLRGQFLSGHALWAEVKHASELLQQSHFRAFSLSEDIADLQESISDAVVHLEELVKTTDEEDMNLEQQKKIRAMLERIRKYYRQMYSDSEPLSVMRIAEDLLRVMDELAQELDVQLRAVQKVLRYCEGV
jgi:molecular chaperone GrpE (heat shock protein)